VVVEIRERSMSRDKGEIAEKRAISFLEDLNFKIIEINFYAKKLGEIDIIAKKNQTYHFIEVKSALDYETAINNITKSKLSKIKRSINYYIQIKNLDIAYCIDAVIITDENVELIENITLL
jgi:putative endonuclease